MNEKKLQKIFQYYKSKYRLNTRAEFDIDGDLCNYSPYYDFIHLGYKEVDKGTLSIRMGIKDKKYLYILALLHEIKHAIDKNILTDELKSFDISNKKSEYHDTRIWEVRADNFAKKEFRKWL